MSSEFVRGQKTYSVHECPISRRCASFLSTRGERRGIGEIWCVAISPQTRGQDRQSRFRVYEDPMNEITTLLDLTIQGDSQPDVVRTILAQSREHHSDTLSAFSLVSGSLPVNMHIKESFSVCLRGVVVLARIRQTGSESWEIGGVCHCPCDACQERPSSCVQSEKFHQPMGGKVPEQDGRPFHG